MAECKLCLKGRELRSSHIIPEFMYTAIYDADPQRYYEIRMVNDEAKSRIEQKGKREKLLCQECESKLSVYEKYADENLYGKNINSEINLINQSMTEDGKIFLYEFENCHYGKMKLFLDSLLWRLIVSNSFWTPKYDDTITEKLRLSILNETPLDECEFPCLIQSIMTGPGKILKGFILSPLDRTSVERQILSVLIDGIDFNFIVSGAAPIDQINPYLNKRGELKIVGRLIYDMPELIQQIKKQMDHLKDRLNNN
ncbi:MAG: hypothetical protein RLO12_22435 [Fulvivirga sp.]